MRSVAARWVIAIVAVLATDAIVASSLSRDYYYFRTEAERQAFSPFPFAAAYASLLSAAEGTVLWLALFWRGDRVSWQRYLVGLLVFVPWMLVLWDQIGTHIPGFMILNTLWVSLIVSGLSVGLAVSVVRGLVRRPR